MILARFVVYRHYSLVYIAKYDAFTFVLLLSLFIFPLFLYVLILCSFVSFSLYVYAVKAVFICFRLPVSFFELGTMRSIHFAGVNNLCGNADVKFVAMASGDGSGIGNEIRFPQPSTVDEYTRRLLQCRDMWRFLVLPREAGMNVMCNDIACSAASRAWTSRRKRSGVRRPADAVIYHDILYMPFVRCREEVVYE